MNILCVIDSLGSGGAQRQLVNLAIGFKERGHEVSFLVYHQENFFKETLDQNNIPVYEVLENNYLIRLIKMRRFIRRENFDAVLSFLEAANFICEIAGLPWRKWKLVVGERSANPNIFRSIKLRFYRWAHLLADKVVANSNENIKMVRRINPLLAKKNCHVIYNIVDNKKWKPAFDYILNKDGKFNLIVVASHQYLKNLNGLINAINLLNDQDKLRIKVDWYGDVRADNSLIEAQYLVQKYSLQHIFSFHSAVENICQKMQYADAIGLFSFYEGLPNVLCEAMVVGKPIISSSVSDIPILLGNDMNCIFNPFITTDITRAISYILTLSVEKKLELSKLNRELGCILFDKNTIISKYINLFN